MNAASDTVSDVATAECARSGRAALAPATRTAHHNTCWLLGYKAGEYSAIGIFGQVLYINCAANAVMAWFASQPEAGYSRNPVFHDALRAARELATQQQPA